MSRSDIYGFEVGEYERTEAIITIIFPFKDEFNISATVPTSFGALLLTFPGLFIFDVFKSF